MKTVYSPDYGPQLVEGDFILPDDWSENPDDYPDWSEQPVHLEPARQGMQEKLIIEYKKILAPVKNVYPEEEQQGWTIQEREAEKVVSGQTSELLNKWVQNRGLGETPEEFAQTVLSKRTEWETLYSEITARQQGIYHKIKNAQSMKELLEIKINLTGE